MAGLGLAVRLPAHETEGNAKADLGLREEFHCRAPVAEGVLAAPHQRAFGIGADRVGPVEVEAAGQGAGAARVFEGRLAQHGQGGAPARACQPSEPQPLRLRPPMVPNQWARVRAEGERFIMFFGVASLRVFLLLGLQRRAVIELGALLKDERAVAEVQLGTDRPFFAGVAILHLGMRPRGPHRAPTVCSFLRASPTRPAGSCSAGCRRCRHPLRCRTGLSPASSARPLHKPPGARRRCATIPGSAL